MLMEFHLSLELLMLNHCLCHLPLYHQESFALLLCQGSSILIVMLLMEACLLTSNQSMLM